LDLKSSLEQASTDPDATLVDQARRGDRNAVAELYRRYERQAYNLAFRLVGNPWDAADVTQEAFIKAFRNLEFFKGESRFSTWLHRIVVNAAYDYLRRQKPEPADAEMMEELARTASRTRVVGGGSSRDLEEATDELSVPLKQALLDLAPGFRLAVVLCDLLGFSYAEAAEILGVREGTIKSRLFRAREALATALRKAGYEENG